MSRPMTTGEFTAFRVWLADRLDGLEQRIRQPLPLASKCQKCGLVAGVTIGYVDERNGMHFSTAAWCCPRCVNRGLERIEELEALIRAMNQGGQKPAERER